MENIEEYGWKKLDGKRLIEKKFTCLWIQLASEINLVSGPHRLPKKKKIHNVSGFKELERLKLGTENQSSFNYFSKS